MNKRSEKKRERERERERERDRETEREMKREKVSIESLSNAPQKTKYNPCPNMNMNKSNMYRNYKYNKLIKMLTV